MRTLFLLLSLFLFSACAVVAPKVEQVKTKEKQQKLIAPKVEDNKSVVIEAKKSNLTKLDKELEGNVIVNVFADELYFEKDKVGEDKTAVVIKYLDAYAWEKKALAKVYKKYKRLWSKKQSEEFKEILEEDRYLSLCSDRKYWDNLEFEESEPERDILQSVLLIRYVNNLEHGCPKWVASNAKIRDENAKEHTNMKQLFSLLPHEVIIEKLISLYVPKEKEFRILLKQHQNSLDLDKGKELLKLERLELEEFKCQTCQPNYKNRK